MSEKFIKKLTENMKQNGLSESSIKLYIRNLKKLSHNDLTNLKFLKETEKVEEELAKYKYNTKRNYLISIVSGLKSNGDTTSKIYKYWHSQMMDLNKKLRNEENSGEKSETQKENWIGWESVKSILKEKKEECEKFINSKTINEHQYNTLLNCLILALYTTSVEPRRNADYLNCYVVKKYKNDMDDKKNYLDLSKGEFIFNVFKTAKKEGQKIIPIGEELKEIIDNYLKYQPVYKESKKNNIDVPFLVDYGGNKLPINGITLRLNQVFGKKISSSMLRHIYLSYKFGDIQKEMKETANNMSHSESMQKNYIKN